MVLLVVDMTGRGEAVIAEERLGGNRGVGILNSGQLDC
jgi:hypothetical protein